MKKIVFTLLIFSYFTAFSQESSEQFLKNIEQFKQLNKENPPPKDGILFIGSSTIANWSDMTKHFPNKKIINRGFVGARLSDLNYFADDLLYPYQPKQIVIYCGDNDFADNLSVDPQTVANRYITFYQSIRKRFPKVEVDFISIKYSPSRENLWPKMEKTNKLIKQFMRSEKNGDFIDMTLAMSDAKGNVRKDLFLPDMLHLKPKTYKMWADVLRQHLK